MLLLARSKGGRLSAFISVGQVSFLAGVTLFTAFVVGGSGYLIRELHRQVGVAWSAAGLPASLAPAAPPPIVTSDMLHVSSIALGRAPVAVVNGRIIGEGASVTLETPEGSATLRATSIVDGAVRFRYGSQTISANLRQTFPRKVDPK
ncbi:MAG TPA: hypothetical protein VEP30_04755 [Chthoniobacterales bacterium]|nr:hypothetical protein [Chthoniobacterales bacterium]